MNRIVYSVGITVLTIIFLLSLSWAQEIEDDLRRVQVFVDNEDEPVNWLVISKAIQRLGEKRAKESKGLLLRILKRNKQVDLTSESPIPGIMSPLDIIKTVAMDALTNIGATEHREDLQKISANTKNHVLREKAKMNLKRISEHP